MPTNPDHSHHNPNTEGWGAIIWSLIALVLSVFALIINIVLQPPPTNGRITHNQDGTVLQDIKKQMRKHGVQVAYEDWNGKLYFMRNGEKVYL